MKEQACHWRDHWNDLPDCMRRFATHIGPTDAHVLLLGPTGSGKGYLARILHDLSPRATGPFVSQNCGVFTESLAGASLFGVVKGAFTGATDSIQGGAKFWIKAVESDPGPTDDQLGKFRLWWNDSGKELEFDENDDDDADLSVWLVWESDS